MTNLEKYKKDIEPYSICNLDWGIHKGRVCRCEMLICSGCIFYGNVRCKEAKFAWLTEEYKEPEVDWSKVPVDTKILVSQNGDDWVSRYFCKFQYGLVYAWNNGATSWSADKGIYYSTWKFAKLAED